MSDGEFLFEISHSQRDRVISVFSALNTLLFPDDRQKEIDVCTEANKVIVILNNLEPTNEAGEPFETPAKKARTETQEEALFEIRLETLERVVLQLMKCRKAGIQYSSSVGQLFKTRLLHENHNQIVELLGLPKKKNDRNSPTANEREAAGDAELGDHRLIRDRPPNCKSIKQRSQTKFKTVYFDIKQREKPPLFPLQLQRCAAGEWRTVRRNLKLGQ